jgi:hypothetical protein
MEYHLQNVRTGETVKLDPGGTLIGNAEHAAIQTTEDGPYLAAFVVRYPSEWALFGLANDPNVTFERRALQPGQRVPLSKGALLTIGEERYTFRSPQTEKEPTPLEEHGSRPVCFAYVTYPDGKEECRTVDHDLLFGRWELCHVQLADTRLSRLNALLVFDDGEWYIHNLAKKPIGRNRKPVHRASRLADGDVLLIGPLSVRVEMRTIDTTPMPPRSEDSDSAVNVGRAAISSAEGIATSTDFSDATDDGTGEKPATPNLEVLRENAQQLEGWLKSHPPRAASSVAKGALAAWIDAQRDRLKRFWLDTPETTNARSLRTAGRVEEAFTVLERAIRARSDSPELLRELYRLYDSLGFLDLCYRPLRQIEKLAEVRGTSDVWVLETLAQLCEKLGAQNPSMVERSLSYWTKVETATGTVRTREKANVLARRAIRDGGYAGTPGDAM